MMQIQPRKATDGDIRWCVERMWNEISPHLPNEEETPSSWATNLINRKNTEWQLWQVCKENVLLAFALVSISQGSRYLLYIRSLETGKGYGTELLEKIRTESESITLGIPTEAENFMPMLKFCLKCQPSWIGLAPRTESFRGPVICFMYPADEGDKEEDFSIPVLDSVPGCNAEVFLNALHAARGASKGPAPTPLNSEFLSASADVIRQLLKDAGADQCSIHIKKEDLEIHDTFYSKAFKNATPEEEQDPIYAIGSLTNTLVAILLWMIVENLSLSENPGHEGYRRLRDRFQDPWNAKFVDVFNSFTGEKIPALPRNPTVWQVLIHYNSWPPMTDRILAPDGTLLASKTEFPKLASDLAKIAYNDSTRNNIEFSNGNYIMASLLIEAISGEPLEKAMKKHLFDPLGMRHTSIGAPDAEIERLAQGLPDPHLYPADCLVSGAFGAYSSTSDFATLFRAIRNHESPFASKSAVSELLSPRGVFNDGTGTAIAPFGVYTTLNSIIPGSRCINRLISPEDICSTYRLGQNSEPKDRLAFYATGGIGSVFSCYYYIPKRKFFVIVFTSGGHTDASDHITRYILQQAMDLQLSFWDLVFLALKLHFNIEGVRPSDLCKRVNICDMSKRSSEQSKAVQKKWAEEDAEEDTSQDSPIQLEGRYKNEHAAQSITIAKDGDKYVATISGTAATSQPMRLGYKDMEVRLQPLKTPFTIDRHESWEELTFMVIVSEAGTKVTGLKRKTDELNLFQRVEDAV